MTLRHAITVDVLNHRGDGRLPGLVGYRVMAIEQGLLVAELDIRPDLLAPNGFLHAATVIALRIGRGGGALARKISAVGFIHTFKIIRWQCP